MGNLWLHLKIKDRISRLYFVCYWLKSYLFFAIVVLASGTKYENIQIVFICYLNLFSLIFTATMDSYEVQLFNKIERFNELMIGFITFHLTSFSDMVDDYEL